jgi:hypothetical protein
MPVAKKPVKKLAAPSARRVTGGFAIEKKNYSAPEVKEYTLFDTTGASGVGLIKNAPNNATPPKMVTAVGGFSANQIGDRYK